ncbi:MAG: 6-bladed beta-propeller [Acidobacteriota bacterium]
MLGLHTRQTRWAVLTLLGITAIQLAGCTSTDDQPPPDTRTAEQRVDRQRPIDAEIVARIGYGDDGQLAIGRPRFVRSTSDGRTLVVDGASNRVLVYDQEARLTGSVGGRGRDPGQFFGIHAFHVDDRDELLVFDGFFGQLTRLNLAGEVLGAQRYERRDLLWPRGVLTTSQGDLVYLCRLPRQPKRGEPSPDAGFLFHHYASDGPNKTTAFAAVATDSSRAARRRELLDQSTPGHFWIRRDGTMLFTASAFDGRILRFRQVDDGWEPLSPLESFVPDSWSVETLTLDEAKAREIPYVKFNNSLADGVFHRRHESRGVFETRDGSIVHFRTITSPDGVRSLGVDTFDADGRYLGYADLDVLGFVEPTVAWMDRNDRFYFVEGGTNRGLSIVALQLDSQAAERTPSTIARRPDSEEDGHV